MANMKKMVLKVAIDDEKSKRRVMQTVAGVEGVESVSVDMKEKKITVIGEADPVSLTIKLRKFGFTELLSVGPAKEEKKEEKKDEKKPAPEKKEEKKDDGKKEEKKDSGKKEDKKAEPPTVVYANPSSTSYMPYQPGYSYTVVKDDYSPTCTIC